MKKKIDYYYNEQKDSYAVLITKGKDAGWSTKNIVELAYDKNIIIFWIENHTNENFMREIGKYEENPSKKYFRDFLVSNGYYGVDIIDFGKTELIWIPIEKECKIVIERREEKIIYLN